MVEISFQFRCKIASCQKVLGLKESPEDHLTMHAEENMANFFDLIPVVKLKG